MLCIRSTVLLIVASLFALPAFAAETGQVPLPDGLSVQFQGDLVSLSVVKPDKSFLLVLQKQGKEGEIDSTRPVYLSPQTGLVTLSSKDYQRLALFEIASSVGLGFSAIDGWKVDGRPCVCILPPPPPPPQPPPL